MGVTNPFTGRAPGTNLAVFPFKPGTKHPLIDSTPGAIDHKTRGCARVAVCLLLGGQLRELLGGGGASLVGESAQLVQITQFGCELDELVGRGGAATVGKAPQLLQVAALGSELD